MEKMFIQCSLKINFQGQREPQKQKSKETISFKA